ncbi:RNA-directed DNA polymerase, eukaryota [Tanacetum coccineum]
MMDLCLALSSLNVKISWKLSYKLIKEGKNGHDKCTRFALKKWRLGEPNFLSDDEFDDLSSDGELFGEDDGQTGRNKENGHEQCDVSDVEKVSESSFTYGDDIMQDNILNKNAPCIETIHSDDPFHIYGILNKKVNKDNHVSEELPFPLGFTPAENAGGKNLDDISEKVKKYMEYVSKEHSETRSNDKYSSQCNNNFQRSQTSGSLLEVLDDMVKVGQATGNNMKGLGHKTKKGWIKELCAKHRINFVTLQETKMEKMDLFTIKALWGNLSFDYAVSYSVGNSGGILCVWDHNLFVKDHVSSSNYFLAIMGTWTPTSTKLLIISVYAPQELSEKRQLWDFLSITMTQWEGEVDFDKVVEESWKSSHFEESNVCDSKKLSDVDKLIDQGELNAEAIEGDENSKYFHGILNKKRSNIAICGILRDEEWLSDPNQVNSKFLNYFTNRFSEPQKSRFIMDFQFPNRLSLEQSEELESGVSCDEIKKALLECGLNKSPGWLFVDFENAFNSIRWDYLDDTLKSFGFGEKWRDDVVFIGEWSDSNIKTTVHVLKCFFLASGFKINLHKRKLMWIGVRPQDVTNAANAKLKTLSSEERLRLIKSVLTAIPLYHMSIFKVLIYVLNNMESIRRNFFNGVEGLDRKLTWNAWKNVLASKEKGDSSLWSKFIKAVHGAKGSLDNVIIASRRSPRLDILREVSSFKSKGETTLRIQYPRLYSLELHKDINVAEKLGHPSLVRTLLDDFLLPKFDVPTRWINVSPIKVNIFAWRVRLDKLPMRLNLSLKGMEIPSILCPSRNVSMESSSHLFFSCSLARQVWCQVLRWWELVDNGRTSCDD